jgi:hypothetical protein
MLQDNLRLWKVVNFTNKIQELVYFRREHWDKFSTFNCWSQLLEITRKQSHDHGILAEICGSHVFNRLSEIQENSQRIFKKVIVIGSMALFGQNYFKIIYKFNYQL